MAYFFGLCWHCECSLNIQNETLLKCSLRYYPIVNKKWHKSLFVYVLVLLTSGMANSLIDFRTNSTIFLNYSLYIESKIDNICIPLTYCNCFKPQLLFKQSPHPLILGTLAFQQKNNIIWRQWGKGGEWRFVCVYEFKMNCSSFIWR